MNDPDYKEPDPFRKAQCDDPCCPHELPANDMTECTQCGKQFCPVCRDDDMIYDSDLGEYICKECQDDND